jgi:hypothetical protein
MRFVLAMLICIGVPVIMAVVVGFVYRREDDE